MPRSLGNQRKVRGRPWAGSKGSESSLSWLWGPWLLGCKLPGHWRRAGVSQKSPGSQVGYSRGSTSPPLTPGLHGRKQIPANTVHMP